MKEGISCVILVLMFMTLVVGDIPPVFRIRSITGDLSAQTGYDWGKVFESKHAFLRSPCGLCFGMSDEIYISDCTRHVIFKMYKQDETSVMEFIGGMGFSGYNGNGYESRKTVFNTPSSLSIDKSTGDLYVADTENNAIRFISNSDGLVYSIEPTFNKPLGIAVSLNGFVYIADTGNNYIKKYNIKTKEISIIAGLNPYLDGNIYDNIDAISLIVKSPKSIHVVSNGNEDTVYFIDDERLKSIDSKGKYRKIGESAQTNLFGIFVQSNEIWTSSKSSHFVQMQNIASLQISTFIGKENEAGYEGDNLEDSYSKVRFYNPASIIVNGSIVYVADYENNCIRMIDTIRKVVSTITGGLINHALGENISVSKIAPSSTIAYPFIYNNELYFVESTNILRKVSNGIVKTVFGSMNSLKIANSPTRTYSSINDYLIFPNGDLIVAGDSMNLYNLETKLFYSLIGSASSVCGFGNSFLNGTLFYASPSILNVYKNGNYSTIKSTGLNFFQMKIVNENGEHILYSINNVTSIARVNLTSLTYQLKTLPFIIKGIESEKDKLYVYTDSTIYEWNWKYSYGIRLVGRNSYNVSGTLVDFTGYNGEQVLALESLIQPNSIHVQNGSIYIAESVAYPYITQVSNGISKTIVGQTPIDTVGRLLHGFALDEDDYNILYFLGYNTIKKINQTSQEITTMTTPAASSQPGKMSNPLPYLSLNNRLSSNIIFSKYDKMVYVLTYCELVKINPKTFEYSKVAGNDCNNIIVDIPALNSPIGIDVFGLSEDYRNGDLYLSSAFTIYRLERSSGKFRIAFSSNKTTGIESPDGPVTKDTCTGQFTSSRFTPEHEALYFSTSTKIRALEKTENGFYLRTIVGNGENGYNGDNLPALQSSMSSCSGFHVLSNGDIILLDSSIIRKFVNKTGILTIVAGSPNQYSQYYNGDTKAEDSKFFSLRRFVHYNEKMNEIYFLEGLTRGVSQGYLIRKLTPTCNLNAQYNTVNQTCECLSGFIGLNCEPITCNGTKATETSSVCNGNGNCVDLDTCKCLDGFSGRYCDKKSLDNQSTILIIAITIPVIASLLLIAAVVVFIVIVIGIGFYYTKRNEKNASSEIANIPTNSIELSDFPSKSMIISSSNGSINSQAEDAFSRYSDIQKIGQGAFGSVFKVKDIENGNKTKAVKVMRFESFTDLNTIMKEASQLSHIKHPNILKVNDYFITNDHLLCIDMDYYESGDLTRFLKCECDEVILRQILKQMLSALTYVHEEMSIIHRDIKPSNIFIKNLTNDNISVVLADFGLAKKYQEQLGQSYVGTPFYMSPEIALGSSYSFNTDIFSLGVTMYQIMTRSTESSSLSIGNLLMMSGNDISSSQSTLIEQIKQEPCSYSEEIIEIVVRKMLDKDARTRPSASQLIKLDYFNLF